jgi:hypothetical protein
MPKTIKLAFAASPLSRQHNRVRANNLVDVGQVDLVSWLSDRTSEKMTVLPFESYFL